MDRKKILSILGLSLLVFSLVISCSTNSPPNFQANEGETETIVIGYSNWVGWWPWAIAEQSGIFAKNNVRVEMKWFDGYLESLEALAAGQLDGNCQTLNDTISFATAAVNGEVAILVNDNSAGNDKIIVAAEIDRIEDLKGKQVALEAGVVNDFLLSLALESHGMKRADVEIVNLETSAAAVAFATEQTDAVGAFPPYWSIALERQGAKELISSAEFPGSIVDLLVVSQSLIDGQPNKVRALVKSWFDTMEFMAQHPAQADRIMAARAEITVEELQQFKAGTKMFTLADNLAAFAPGSTMKQMPFAAQKIANFMLDIGFINEVPDLTKILDDSLYQSTCKIN